jgi:hypothetical protein
MNQFEEQKIICEKYQADFLETYLNLKVGISSHVKDGILPVHGLRLHPDEGTTGWFIWAGEYSDDPDFFKPLHVKHLNEWCPWIIKYLGLAPGWRFLVTPDHEDVWQDKSILKTKRLTITS